MNKRYTDAEEQFCRIVLSVCLRPGMFTANSTVNEAVHFLSGMHHALFPERASDFPMIRYKESVLDPSGEYSNIRWTRVLSESFCSADDAEDWFASFKKSFQEFCLLVYGDRFEV